MSNFLDTSALVKHFVEEIGSDEIRALVASDTVLWVSEVSTIEGVSALAKKVRMSEITRTEFQSLLRAFVLFLASGRCNIQPLDDDTKDEARRLLSSYSLSQALLSLDALHLASATRATVPTGRTTFYTSDQKLLAAAQVQGFAVRNPGVS